MNASTDVMPDHVLPSLAALEQARQSLPRHLPVTGISLEQLESHLEKEIVPALNQASQSSRFYGFVTGGATRASLMADAVVSRLDQNVQVHLPNDTICTELEHSTLAMCLELFRLDPDAWPHRTFTTGATASNVVGLACAREWVLLRASEHAGHPVPASIAQVGLSAALKHAGIDSIQILASAPHSSIGKAASIIGLGRDSVKSVSAQDSAHQLDLPRLEQALALERTASIIVISCGEVNTGMFATNGLEHFQQVRNLADRYNAWIHVDGAFGLLARLLPEHKPHLSGIRGGVEGIELADSIAGDAHKLLNVPYDCGIFFSKHLTIGTDVFQNAGAPYLSADPSSIPSPLNIGIENSRRFRALPVYANLLTLGQVGFCEMLERQIGLARQIAAWIDEHPAYELLPQGSDPDAVFIVVLFRALKDNQNADLVARINATRQIFVSGTSWQGKPAARFAVS